MNQRVSESDLHEMARVLNSIAGTPQEYGKAGNYHISFAYGGSSLHQQLEGGGIREVLSCGHVPKKKLYELMSAYSQGLQEGRRSNDEKD